MFTGLTKIAWGAFRESSISSVTLPINVIDIDGYAFYKTTNILTFESIKNIAQIQSIGMNTFRGSTIGGELHLPNLTALGEGAFRECPNITKVTSLGSITTLPSFAFMDSPIKEITLPDTLISIENNSIKGSSVEIINLPKSLKRINSATFWGLKAPISVDLPNLVTLVGSGFRESSIIEIADLGELVLLSNNTFTRCYNLRSATLPSGMYNIMDENFMECTSLETINLDMITTLGARVFRDCSKLNVDINMPNLESLGSHTFQRTAITNVLSLGKITSIPGGCFSTTTLEYIVLPKSIKTLNAYSFEACKNLRLQQMGNIQYIQEIKEGVFMNAGLQDDVIDLPNLSNTLGVNSFRNTKVSVIESLGSVIEIGNYAFLYCNSITAINLPSTIETIGTQAFDCSQSSNNRCKNIVCYATTPPTLGDNAFRGRTSTSTFYVPDDSLENYKEATGWVSFASRIKGISELPE